MINLVIYYTDKGNELANQIKNCSNDQFVFETLDGRSKESALVKDIIAKQFAKKNGIIFIAACGIAVRMIAPFVCDKLVDSPVVVIDELGQNVIPILSGHVGGANEIAHFIADKIGARPVITTATDINNKFSVDLFAKANNLIIKEKKDIAKISSRILSGEKVSIWIEHREEDYENISRKIEELSSDLYLTNDVDKADIFIACDKCANGMWLKPKGYIIGIGCKKNMPFLNIEKCILEKCEQLNISIDEIKAIVSIDVKKNENGIIEFCNKYRIDFVTYTKDELLEVEGDFSGSDFVRETVGVDNVCERSVARYLNGNGKIILGKTACSGITIAVGYCKYNLRYTSEG